MKYLSKLLSMLLVGVLLFAGCTDYDEDIKNLNNKIDKVQQELVEGHIAPLRADLETTKTSLETAKKQLNDALGALQTKHDQDIAALKTNLEKQIADAVSNANAAITALEGKLTAEVAAREAAITALTGELNKAKADLEAAYKAADTALQAELLGKIGELETALKGEVSALETKLNGDIATLRTDMEKAVKAANDAIKDANDKIANLQTDLDAEVAARKADIETAKASLEAAKAALQKAIDDEATARANGDAQLATDLANEVAARKAAVTALEEKLQAAIDAEAAAREEADKKLQAQIDATNKALADAKAALEAADVELQKAIDAEAAARKAADEKLAKDLADEVEARKAAVAALEAAIAKLEAKLDAELNLLKARDAQFEAQISALQAGLEAANNKVDAYYNELKGDVAALEAALQAQINQNKADIANNKVNINKLTSDLAALNGQVNGLQQTVGFLANELYKHLAAFNEYQAVVNGRLAAVEALAEQNAVAIEAIEATIADLESQIATNAALINQNVADIAANAAALDEFKKAATNTFEVLANADLALQNAINNLSIYVDSEIAAVRGDLAAAKAAIEAELAASFSALTEQVKNIEAAHAADNAAVKAELEAIQSTVNALSKYLGDEIAAREAADQKISEALNALNLAYDLKMREIDAKIAALDTRLTSLEEELKAYREEVKKMIDNAIVTAVNKAKDYTDLKINSLETYINEQVEELNENMSNAIKAAKEEAAAALAAAVKAIDLKIENLQDQIDEIAEQLASMIQNITFVPEFADGKATAVRILGPKKGNSLTATTLTAQFDIVPAEAVNGLVNYLSENNSVRVYAKVQPVKPSRVEPIYAEGAQIVIAPDATVAGRVTVTAFVKNMPEDYANYAFALGVETQKTQAMSDFVFIHENSDAQYEYTFVNAENKTIEESHPNYDADQNAIVFSKKWTKAAESLVNVVEGYTFKLTDGEKFYTTAEIAARHNMAEGALDLNMDVEVADVDKCVAVEGTSVKMVSESEYDMYNHIGHSATVTLSAESAIATDWSYAVNAIYNIVGPRVEKNVYYITEPGDLYWLSVDADLNNVSYDKVTVIFDVLPELKDLLMMNGYMSNKPAGEFLPINFNGGEKSLTGVGNNAIVNGLKIKGQKNVGLFGYVVGNIERLHVMNATIEGDVRVGGLVGQICGNVENCSVDNSVVRATPVNTGSEWDDGNSVGGIVGYLEADAENGPYYNVKNCVVSGVQIYGFRDAGSVVGTAYVGTDNVSDNLTNNVQILVNQRPALYPGYIKPANIGHIIGRVLPAAKAPYAWAENKNVFNFDNSSLRIQYALGAEVDATSVDAADHTLEIFTANGLAWFSNNVVNKNYYTYSNVIFTDNIDFGGKTYFEDDKCTFKAINNWVGSKYRSFNFDGQNKVVSNLTINDPTAKDLGLFGSYVGDVKNVTMNNVALIGLGRIAPVATQLWGNIDNCHVDGFVGYAISNGDDGDKVGGLVAQMQDPNAITNCSVKNADIEGYRDLGAVAGMANLNKYENVVVENVNIWINQVVNAYGSYVPFATESALVGRQTGAVKPALEAEGVNVYNILNAELGRRYVTDRKGDLYLGYDVTTSTVADQLVANAAGRALKFDAKQNSAALFQFAAEYKSYKEKTVNQVTDMNLEGKTWNAIGASNDGFWGIYNGNNKTISNLQVIGYETTPSGLFGEVVGDIKNVKITGANISGCHYAGAVAARLFGTIEGCEVSNSTIVLLPNVVTTSFDNGDKAGALVGYLAANNVNKVINNKVSGVNVKAYREVAALVGRANTIDEMSGNVVENSEIVLDQMIAGSYVDTKDYFSTIGTLIGRLDDNTTANITNNTVTNVNLNTVDAKGVEAKIENPKEVGLNE